MFLSYQLPHVFLATAYAAICVAQATSSASSCSATALTPSYPTPSVAPGWEVKLIATDLNSPRGILFDASGNLLVVEQGRGISRLSFTDTGGSCLEVRQKSDVILDSSLNHGIELDSDSHVLYASSFEAVYAWDYDPEKAQNTSQPRTLVTGMANADHTTRTLLLSKKVPGALIVSRGSTSNLDPAAEDLESGHSQIKVFNLTSFSSDPYDFSADGVLLGWGLRNSVGLAEEPVSGGIFSVENSVDEMRRDGVDIHQDNPGEELNFHGYLNQTSGPDPRVLNYGYPICFAAWDVNAIPSNDNIQVGTQFAIGDQNSTVNDTVCATKIPPRLTFGAHMAPLDIKFNSIGTAAWITFHGSWDRTEPVGYKLSIIEFSNGMPVEPLDSTTAAIDIVANQDNSKCPDSCFRPVGLAWDSKGRLFMSSDATGEIYVITKANGGSAASAVPTTGQPYSTSGGATASSTTTKSSAVRSCSHTPIAALIAFTMICLLL